MKFGNWNDYGKWVTILKLCKCWTLFKAICSLEDLSLARTKQNSLNFATSIKWTSDKQEACLLTKWRNVVIRGKVYLKSLMKLKSEYVCIQINTKILEHFLLVPLLSNKNFEAYWVKEFLPLAPLPQFKTPHKTFVAEITCQRRWSESCLFSLA